MRVTAILALILAAERAGAEEIDLDPGGLPDDRATWWPSSPASARSGSAATARRWGASRWRWGAGGNGKTRTGDHRTPLGTYAFGTPRPSRLYGTFIPIDYPTPEQVATGHSGERGRDPRPPARPVRARVPDHRHRLDAGVRGHRDRLRRRDGRRVRAQVPADPAGAVRDGPRERQAAGTR